jgi:hypothetical protein
MQLLTIQRVIQRGSQFRDPLVLIGQLATQLDQFLPQRVSVTVGKVQTQPW